jgi:transposase
MTLEEQILILIAENKKLKEINKELESNIIKQEKIISQQNKRIEEQDKRITELERLLHKAMLFKDSSNSSKPPSTDISTPKRNQSLREKSGKKSGGQIGHKGTTLEMSANPDEIIKLVPEYCNNCGSSLSNAVEEFQSKRQVVDIPPVHPIITEYQKYRKCCPHCGNHQETDFPAGVTNHIQYGSNVEAAIAYFSVYQIVPYHRLKECLKHYFNLDISEGSIYNILFRIASKAIPVYNHIKEKVLESNHIGSDETSVKVGGDKWWIWVWQTSKYTYISSSKSRGSKTIEAEFPNGLPNTILSSDRWAAQIKTPALEHQFCIAHLLRDLKYLEQLEKNEWSIKMKQVLKDALELKLKRSHYSKSDEEVIQIEQRFDILLQENIPKETQPKSLTLQKKFIKHRNSIFVFLYNADTPPDNNGSERAIRNVKVKQKVSGQFKTGQQIFCILRSVIDTCIKQSIDVLDALTEIVHFQPAE